MAEVTRLSNPWEKSEMATKAFKLIQQHKPIKCNNCTLTNNNLSTSQAKGTPRVQCPKCNTSMNPEKFLNQYFPNEILSQQTKIFEFSPGNVNFACPSSSSFSSLGKRSSSSSDTRTELEHYKKRCQELENENTLLKVTMDQLKENLAITNSTIHQHSDQIKNLIKAVTELSNPGKTSSISSNTSTNSISSPLPTNTPPPSILSSPSTSSPNLSKKPVLSYSDACNKAIERLGYQDSESQQKARKALNSLSAKKPSNISISKAEQTCKCRRIYVNGVPQIPFKELKSSMFELHFILSKIVNISFIAKNAAEFVIQEDYASKFISQVKGIPTWQIIAANNSFDPSKPLNQDASQALKEQVKSAFEKRIKGIATNTQNSPSQVFFSSWCQELNISLANTQLQPQQEQQQSQPQQKQQQLQLQQEQQQVQQEQQQIQQKEQQNQQSPQQQLVSQQQPVSQQQQQEQLQDQPQPMSIC